MIERCSVTIGGRGSVRGRFAALAFCTAGIWIALSFGFGVSQATFTPAKTRTAAIFDKHCKRCHAAPVVSAEVATPWFTGIGDLDALAREPMLVVPGRPDASPLYQVMLARHAPRDVFRDVIGQDSPTSADVEAVRDWIEGLPSRPQACAGRRPVTSFNIRLTMAAWRAERHAGGEQGFVSLAHLANACLSDAELAASARAVTGALASLGGRPGFFATHLLGDAAALVAFPLAEAGFTPEAWQAIVAENPRAIEGAVPADWLAARAGTPSAAMLAARYRADVDLVRAAAEIDRGPAELAEGLGAVEGPPARAARQLRQGLLPRSHWEELAALLQSRPAVSSPVPAAPANGTPLRLAVWSDRTLYAPGDIVTLTATATGDCYLTLIGVDGAGLATVLFPNDLDRHNLLRGGTTQSVPLRSAGYQLRVRDPGEERIVGICATHRAQPEGVVYDFERQRFAILGDWRTYLRTGGERARQLGRAPPGGSGNRANGGRNGRRRAPGPELSVPTAKVPAEARAEIVFRVSERPSVAP